MAKLFNVETGKRLRILGTVEEHKLTANYLYPHLHVRITDKNGFIIERKPLNREWCDNCNLFIDEGGKPIEYFNPKDWKAAMDIFLHETIPAEVFSNRWYGLTNSCTNKNHCWEVRL